MQAAFSLKDKNLISQADSFKNEFTRLLLNAISLSKGVISPKALGANEIVTKYTMDAERATQFATGIYIDFSITSMENSLSTGMSSKNIAMLADNVYMLCLGNQIII